MVVLESAVAIRRTVKDSSPMWFMFSAEVEQGDISSFSFSVLPIATTCFVAYLVPCFIFFIYDFFLGDFTV